MADWLGHIMSNWPTWLIAVAIILFIIVAGALVFYWSLAEGMQLPWGKGNILTLRKTKHGKK